jgi:hypothetical protein
MTSRERVLTVLLGIAGIVAAGAIALAANAISGREIGLSAEPVSLAANAPKPRPAPAVKEDRHADRSGSDELAPDDSGGGSGTSSSSGSGGATGDDHGGDDRAPGPAPSGSVPGPSAPTPEPSGSGPGPSGTAVAPTTTSSSGPGGGDDGGGGHSGPG